MSLRQRTGTTLVTASGWVEVGERCWMRRYSEWDVNVGVVAGRDGVLVIDTRGTVEQGESVRSDLLHLGHGPVRAVVNTHWHFDHTYGNAAFVGDVGDRFYAHENAARDLVGTPALVPSRTFVDHRTVDLGDRAVELRYLGRGHTDGDVVLTVDDVVFAGDLIEQSGDPAFGDDCFPLEWPSTIAALLAIVGERSTVVPGHGLPVDRFFVEAQFRDLNTVSDTIHDLAEAGAPLAAALAHEAWPYPRESLGEAIRRAYAQLR